MALPAASYQAPTVVTVSLLAAVAAQTAAVAVAALAVAVERRVGLPLEQKAAESTQLAESPLAQGSGLD